MKTLAQKIAAQNAEKRPAGLLDTLRFAGKVINEGLLNPNQYNAPAANRFKDSALGLLGGVPGVGDVASGAQAADYWNRGDKLNAGLSALGALPIIPSMAGIIARKGDIPIPDVIRGNMSSMGLEKGWFRGGPAPKGNKRTGPWYTQDRSEAENYAKRFGKNSDVREYAIPSGNYLQADKAYNPKLAHDVAKILDDPYFQKPGAQLAAELRTFADDEPISGADLWQALESRFGNDGAAEVLSRLNAFNGVKGITGGPEAYVFNSAPVRDAHKAAFNPNSPSYDLYGKATLPAILTAGGVGALGMYGVYRNNRQDAAGKKR